MANLAKRVTELENSLVQFKKTFSLHHKDCICFPEGTAPVVGFPIYWDIARLVSCPIHGDRFTRPHSFMYVSKWLREKLHARVVERNSSFFERIKRPEQYRKAYLASFPNDLFPGIEEEERLDGPPKLWRHFLRLGDGTRIQVAESRFYRLGDPVERSQTAQGNYQEWEIDTLRIMWNLFSKRGLIGG